jgi:hypothetical protein
MEPELLGSFIEQYYQRHREMTKNTVLLVQMSKNISLEECWLMTHEEREALIQILNEIREAEEKALNKTTLRN